MAPVARAQDQRARGPLSKVLRGTIAVLFNIRLAKWLKKDNGAALKLTLPSTVQVGIRDSFQAPVSKA